MFFQINTEILCLSRTHDHYSGVWLFSSHILPSWKFMGIWISSLKKWRTLKNTSWWSLSVWAPKSTENWSLDLSHSPRTQSGLPNPLRLCLLIPTLADGLDRMRRNPPALLLKPWVFTTSKQDVLRILKVSLPVSVCVRSVLSCCCEAFQHGTFPLIPKRKQAMKLRKPSCPCDW